jgi:WD40 repeat protein
VGLFFVNKAMGTASSKETVSGLFGMIFRDRILVEAVKPSTSGWTGVVIKDRVGSNIHKKQICLVDVVTNEQLASTVTDAMYISFKFYCPRSNKLVVQVSYAKSYLMICNLLTGKWNNLCRLDANHSHPTVIIDVTGTKLLAVSYNEFQLWDMRLKSPQLRLKVNITQAFSSQACFGPENRLVIMDCENRINTWDESSGRKLSTINADAPMGGSVWLVSSHDGKRCADYCSREISVWVIESSDRLFNIKCSDVLAARFGADDAIIVLSKLKLTAWKISDSSVVFEISWRRAESICFLTFDCIHNTIAAMSRPEHVLVEVNAATGTILGRHPVVDPETQLRAICSTPVNYVVLL